MKAIKTTLGVILLVCGALAMAYSFWGAGAYAVFHMAHGGGFFISCLLAFGVWLLVVLGGLIASGIGFFLCEL